MYNKILSGLIVLGIILFVVSCGNNDNVTGDIVTDNVIADTSLVEDAAAASAAAALDLPEDLDFGGVTFTILACDENVPYTYIEMPEQQDGDIMNDAVYDRNLRVEENLNITLALKTVSGTDTEPLVKSSVLSGDKAYNMVSPHILRSISTLVVQNLLQDLNQVEYVDFEKPWWNKTFSETMKIKGKVFYASGDTIVPNARVIVFNKDMMENYDKEDIYDVVYNGNWTLDKLGEYCADMVVDLDGSGVMDINDQYAFSDLGNTGLATSFVHASDMLFLDISNDSFRLTLNDDKMDVIINKLYDYIYREGNTAITNENFGNGNVLFGSQVLLKLQILRSYDTDFGIIPFPKYDEFQEEYYSSVWNGLLCVPIDVNNIDCAGAVLEAMAYYSSLTLVPAYYEQLLDSKFVRDENSSKMLDIIFDGLIYDFGLCFDNFMGNYSSVGTLLNSGNTDITSFYAANESKYTLHYQEIFDAVE